MDIVQQLDKPAVVLAVIAAPLLAVLYVVLRFARRRRVALRQFALLGGYEFVEKDPELKKAGFADARLFRQNPSRQFFNIIKGKLSWTPFLMFDYMYNSRSVEQEFTYSQTVAVFPAGPALPGFELAPRSVLHGLASALGDRSIEPGGDPEFNKVFWLNGADEAAIRAFFSGGRTNSLLGWKGWSVESSNQHLVIYRHAKLAPAREPRSFLDEAYTIARLFLPD